MSINIKPLTHWAIYKGYMLRFTSRSPALVTGILTMGEATVKFQYDPMAMTISLAGQTIRINEYGWEIGDSPHS